MNETVADRLREAAGRIREDGHVRGQRIDRLGQVCAMGAITRIQKGERRHVTTALRQDATALEATRRLAEHVVGADVGYFALMSLAGAVAGWNDRTAADGEEVAATMEKLAARIEEEV